MIFWIAVTLFFIVNGQDVLFQYDGCYSSENGITMTAKYTGSGTVTGVQWYYSGKNGSNLLVAAATCSVAGLIPLGYPADNQMNFQCPPALDPNTFKLTVTGLEREDLKNSWGATFSLSTGSSPAVADSSLFECGSTTTSVISLVPAARTTGSAKSSSKVGDGVDKKFIFGVSIGVCVPVVLAILIGVCCFRKHWNKNENKKAQSYSSGKRETFSA